LREASEFKELDGKSEKGRENGGFQPPVFANVQKIMSVLAWIILEMIAGFIASKLV
jgi:hypothetical protein